MPGEIAERIESMLSMRYWVLNLVPHSPQSIIVLRGVLPPKKKLFQ